MTTEPTILPAELWLECWAYCDFSTIVSLTLVCRHFGTLSRTILLRKQWLAPPQPATPTLQGHAAFLDGLRRRLRGLRELSANPWATEVRVWDLERPLLIAQSRDHLDIPAFKDIHDVWQRALAQFSTSLGAFQGVMTLRLHDITVDTQLRRTLCSLPVLEEVKLKDCSIPTRTGHRLALKRFSLETPSTRATLDKLVLVDPAVLEELTVDASSDSASLFFALSKQTCPRLTRLNVTISDQTLDPFLDFWAACSQLHELRASFTGSSKFLRHLVVPVPHTPARLMPVLKTFEGTADFACLIVPNRPITRVRLLAVWKPKVTEVIRALEFISYATTPIRALTIDVPVPRDELASVLRAINTHCPGLRELGLSLQQDCSNPYHNAFQTFSGGSAGIACRVCPPLPILSLIASFSLRLPPYLTTLRFSQSSAGWFSRLSDDVQQDAVGVLADVCPMLEEIVFNFMGSEGQSDCWRRRPGKARSEGAWVLMREEGLR